MTKSQHHLARRLVIFITLMLVVVFETMITFTGMVTLSYIFQDNVWISGSILILGFVFICIIMIATVKWFYEKVPT